ILAGKPSLVSRQYLRSLSLSKHRKRIHWLGYLSKKELSSLFKATHYYISSSLSEGCQLSVLEALYAGMPVILTDVGAASDIFGDSYPFLVREHDSQLLAEKIIQASREGVHPSFSPKVQTWSKIGRQMGKFYNDIYSKK
ncbi:MAG: glycosyltransferase, partial [Promethearchaeota archaeon]